MKYIKLFMAYEKDENDDGIDIILEFIFSIWLSSLKTVPNSDVKALFDTCTR